MMSEIDASLSDTESLELVSPRVVSGDFEVRRAFREPVQVEYWRVRERASFDMGGRGYLCRRTGLLGWDFRLLEDGGELAAARRNLTLRRFVIQHGTDELELRSGSAGWTPFILFRDGRPIGRLDRRSPRGRSALAELPADLPEPLRIFVIYLAVVAWRRIAGSIFQAVSPGG